MNGDDRDGDGNGDDNDLGLMWLLSSDRWILTLIP